MPKPHRIATRADLDEALVALLEADKRLPAIAKQAGEIQFVPRRKHGFEALMSIIASQQLSVAAADTIFARLKKAVVPFTPERMLAASAETLRAWIAPVAATRSAQSGPATSEAGDATASDA